MRTMLRGIVIGIVLTIAVTALAAYVVVVNGWFPAQADAPYFPFEDWAAKTALRTTELREMPQGPNPLPATEANLLAGIKLYGANCVVYHGAANGDRSTIAAGMYVSAPLLGRHGVEDDPPGRTFWIVYHGVRFTGMPSFGHMLTEDQVWQLALFLQHMDALPPAAEAAWKAMPSGEPVQLAPASPAPEKARS